ncbi:hypothetical protein ACJJTC_006176 [Scirpophaga incertulas]
MYILILVEFITLAVAQSPEFLELSTSYDYHAKIGIPLATKIKHAEQNICSCADWRTWVGNKSGIDISDVPYQVGLVLPLDDENSFCVGSLISSTLVLTAAHCLDDGVLEPRNSFTVVLGSDTIFSGGHRQEDTQLIMHSYWSSPYLENDIGIIRINHVSFSDVIQPIELPFNNEVLQGYDAIASGWGQLYTPNFPGGKSLWAFSRRIISTTKCQRFMRTSIRDHIDNLHKCGRDPRKPCQRMFR